MLKVVVHAIPYNYIFFARREILIWSQDQTNSVWSHTHKQVFFNDKKKIDKKIIKYFEDNLLM